MIQFMPNMWIFLMILNMIMFMINLMINYYSLNKFKF